VVRHQTNVFLCEAVHGSALGDDAPDKRMVVFCRSLLVGGLCIAVEDSGPLIAQWSFSMAV